MEVSVAEQLTPASLRTVIVTTTSVGVIAIFYAWIGVEPPPIIRTAITLGPLIATLMWFHRDARARRFPLVHDWGFFAWLAWPFLIPWYSFKTRGRPGWRLTIGLYLAILGPMLVEGIVYVLRWPEVPDP